MNTNPNSTSTSGTGGAGAGGGGATAVEVVPEQLSALAVSLRDRAPTVHRSSSRRPSDDIGDRDAGEALAAFYRAHDRALSATLADHHASADHLDATARAYTITQQHNAHQFDPQGSHGPGVGERRVLS